MTGLEFSLGRQAMVVGKPEKTFYDSALRQLNEECNSDIKSQGN